MYNIFTVLTSRVILHQDTLG